MSHYEDYEHEGCETCENMRYVCRNCNAPDGDCECLYGPEIVECPDCADA